MNHDLFLPRKKPSPKTTMAPTRGGDPWAPARLMVESGHSVGEALGRCLEEVWVEKTGANSEKKDGKKTVKMVEHHGKNHEDGGKQFTKTWKWWKTMENTMNMVESRWKQLWEYGDSWKLCDGSPANIANSSGFVKRRVVLWLEISDLT